MVRQSKGWLAVAGAAVFGVLAAPPAGIAHVDPQQVAPGPAVTNDPSATPQFGAPPASAAAPAPAQAAPSAPAAKPSPAQPAAQPAASRTTFAQSSPAARPARTAAPRRAASLPAAQTRPAPSPATVKPTTKQTAPASPQAAAPSRTGSRSPRSTHKRGQARPTAPARAASAPLDGIAGPARRVSATTPAVAPATPRDTSPAQRPLALIAIGMMVALALSAVALVAFLRRRLPDVAVLATPGQDEDEVEAALQRMLAEEHAAARAKAGVSA